MELSGRGHWEFVRRDRKSEQVRSDHCDEAEDRVRPVIRHRDRWSRYAFLFIYLTDVLWRTSIQGNFTSTS